MLDPHYAAVLQAAVKARFGRTNWMEMWQELAELFLPQRGDFTTKLMDGDRRDDGLFSSEPQLAARGLASAVSAMLRPPGKRWFKATLKNPQLMALESAQQWLYLVTDLTYQHLYDPRVNTEKALSEVDIDLVVFGTGVASVDWNVADKHLVIKSRSLANTALVAGRDGKIVGGYIFTQPTLRQIIDEFGEDKLTEKMREAKRGSNSPDLERTFEIVQCILPNEDWNTFQAGKAGRFPYKSAWISVDCKELIDERGFNEFNLVCPRWDTLTGEVYARSPAMVALPDARVVMAMSKTLMEAGEYALRPPTYSFADMIQGDIELWPGGHTIVDMSNFQGTGEPIKSLQAGAIPEGIYKFYQDKVQSMAAAFFRDILELPAARDADMTATEINARYDQYLRQAAPIFNRLLDAYNAALMNRAFSILQREKVFPPPPPELKGQEVEFEYESPIKTAREKAEAMKVIEGLQMILPLAEAYPDILDNYDPDAIARFTGVKADLPPAIFRPIEQMMQMREAREQEMQAMKAAELAKTAAPAMAASGGMLKAVGDAKTAGLLESDQALSPELGGADPLGALEGIYEEVA